MPPRCAPSAKSRPPQNTSSGCVSGTKGKSTHPCPSHGQNGSKTRWKKWLDPKRASRSSHGSSSIGRTWVLANLGALALSVTIDATPTSADPRAQAWIYALCVHGYSLGALQRKGTITGMAKGAQTKARALFQGLLTLAQFIQTPTRVVVQVSSVWEAWTNPSKRKGFQDLAQGHPAEYYTLITPLYVHKNHRTPEAPGNEPHLRQRQRDAAIAAWERATHIHN